MLHPNTELRYVDGTVGHGVFATAPIPMGTFTWVKDALDRVFTPKQILGLGAAFEPLVSHCTFADERGASAAALGRSYPLGRTEVADLTRRLAGLAVGLLATA